MLYNENGQKALVGIGFTERNDSFDFNAGLEDYRKALRSEKGLDMPSKSDSSVDFSLKVGEKINISVPGL